jgi:ParB/RepB/Spo0J family partition protein
MNQRQRIGEIRMIPIDQIEVINSRERNSHVFGEITKNIKAIGLKKPIKVTPRVAADGKERYLLVCGEGRLKAYKSLGETSIPALVVNVSDEDAFIMSLAENIARRWPGPLERLASIRRLQEQGYAPRSIAEKTGLTLDYVQGILKLFRQGEERLVIAVETGRISLTAALTIVGAGNDDSAVEAALQEAYESGKLRGKPLMAARRVIERRKTLGRAAGRAMSRKAADVTTSSLVRAYQNEVAPEGDDKKGGVRTTASDIRRWCAAATASRRELRQPAARGRSGDVAEISCRPCLGQWESSMTGVTLGFIPEPLSVPLSSILPSRRLPPTVAESRNFRKIKSSIEEVGLVEPLSVTPADKASGHYVLLDGHLRLLAMQNLAFTEAECLVATDDETYTYNNRVNRLSTIQQHVMIRRVVDRGVSPERLAKALAIDVATVLRRLSLLDGICKEAADLLADRQFSLELSRVLRKMKPMRQVECIELMIAANTVTVRYAEALLVATPSTSLVEGKKPKKMNGVSPEQAAKMEREMSNLQVQYKLVEQTYGQDVLNLVLAKGYLAKLLENKPAQQYLRKLQPGLLTEFEAIVATISLDRQLVASV